MWPNLVSVLIFEERIQSSPESNCEAVGGGGVEELVVFVPVAVLEQDQVVVVHHLLAKNHRQELRKDRLQGFSKTRSACPKAAGSRADPMS